jgi:protein-S-isoprenylcysteine O-methyltransferase Ste14
MSSNPRVHATRLYSACCYAAFIASLGWAIAFLANVPGVATVDGSPSPPAWQAVLIDAGLLLFFAIPHSVLARQGVKQRLRRVIPEPVERSTFVLVASLSLSLLLWQWQSLPAVVWSTDSAVVAFVAWTVYGLGWALVVASTFLADHLEFVGLRQGGWTSAGRPQEPERLSERWLFAWVRHPMMLGVVIAVWVTPTMTVGHLLFAAGSSAYIGVGVHFEERDLRRRFGMAYQEYAQRVPSILPRPPRTRHTAEVS